MAKWPEVRNDLVPILPLLEPELITLCALFYGQSRLSPKVQALLDFLEEYIGTHKHPRLPQKLPEDPLCSPSAAIA
jgi:DNA-binding transcriptional LysR family regulator